MAKTNGTLIRLAMIGDVSKTEKNVPKKSELDRSAESDPNVA
jgi:hypothetical protein